MKAFTLGGYTFTRVTEYDDRRRKLSRRGRIYSEIQLEPRLGAHAITAEVQAPDPQPDAVLEWEDSPVPAIHDICLLLSLFTARHVFTTDITSSGESDEQRVLTEVPLADHREYTWGGVLQCAVPRPQGFEGELNRIYELVRSPAWQNEYHRGYFLFLANQAFRSQAVEAVFVQCWTIWEHLFHRLNSPWMSSDSIRNFPEADRIAFMLHRFGVWRQWSDVSRARLKDLLKIRNYLVHEGKRPEQSPDYKSGVLFIRWTECILARILGLEPSNVHNTIEKTEAFFK